MPRLDHRAPVPLAKTLTAHAVREHRLDLVETRPPHECLVLEHSARLDRIVLKIRPAILARRLEELGHDLLVVGPRHDEAAIVSFLSATPLPDRSKPVRV